MLFLLNFFLVFGLRLDYEYTCRISSFVHAILSSFFGFLYIFEFINYNILAYSIYYSIVYLLIDLYLYYTYKIDTKDIVEMTIHHSLFILIALIAYKFPLYYSYGIICEMSTIFLNLRWFAIKKLYVKNIALYSILLWINFLIFRILNLNYLGYSMVMSEYCLYSILLIPFLILNMMWFYSLTLDGINRYIIKN